MSYSVGMTKNNREPRSRRGRQKGIYFPLDLLKKTTELADATGRSFSNYVQKAVKEYNERALDWP